MQYYPVTGKAPVLRKIAPSDAGVGAKSLVHQRPGCAPSPPARRHLPLFTSIFEAVMVYSMVTFAPTFKSPFTFVPSCRSISHF